MSITTQLSASVHAIGTDDAEVCVSLQVLPIVRDRLLFADNSDALVAIKGLVGDLHLEWEMLDFVQIDVLHLGEFRDLLQRVLEGDLGIFGDVTNITGHQGLVLGEIGWVLVSEAEAFVQLDLALHVGGYDWLREDVDEVVGQLGRVHTFDLTAGHFSQLCEGIKIAVIAND